MRINDMNILNLPEFEVIDTIQDEHDMTVIVKPVKEPLACPECGGVKVYKNYKEKVIKEAIDSYEGKIPEPFYSRLKTAMYNYKVEIDD